MQCARLPCPSLSPRICSNSCLLTVMLSNHLILCCPLLLLPSIFPASGSFPMSQLFTSGGQSTGASASASVLPMNIQGWYSLGLISFISYSPRDSQESSPAPQFKSINSSVLRLLYNPTVTSIHGYWINHTFDYTDFVGKVMSLLKIRIDISINRYRKMAHSVRMYQVLADQYFHCNNLKNKCCKHSRDLWKNND